MVSPIAMGHHAKTRTKTQVLLAGAIRCPGKRSVTSALRVLGLRSNGSYNRPSKPARVPPEDEDRWSLADTTLDTNSRS